MNKMMKAALAATLVAGAAQTARADLTLNGAVGLPLNPTAQIPLQGGIRLQGDYFDFGDIDEGGDKIADAKFYGIHAAGRVGAFPLEINGGFEQLSVNGDTGDPFIDDAIEDSFDKSGIAIGAKYLFTRETDPAGIRLAAGVGYSRALLKNVHAYVVGTKYLGNVTGDRVPVTAHLGLRYDRFKLSGDAADADDDDSSSKLSIYGGVEIPITRNGDFSFVGELQSKNTDDIFGDAKIPFSASVRFRPRNQAFSASLGFMRQGLIDDTGLFAQLGYSFDTSGAGAGQ